MADATSHDHNFKNLIVDYPRESLAFFAPGEAPAADDRVRIVPVRQEQLKKHLRGSFRALDTPLLVEWRDGRRDAIVFALEEESDWRVFSPHRLAHYCLDLAEMHGSDRVVPVVIFLREADRAPASLAVGTERRAYLNFGYIACKLAAMPAERWMDSGNIVARINLPNMRMPRERRVEFYAAATRGLVELESDPAKLEKYLEFIDIYADLTDNERRRYEQQYPQESKAVRGIVQRARDEGHDEGRVEGRVEGERTLLQRLLRRRFGLLTPEAAARVERASIPDLESWAENVLDAGTLDEVFAPNGRTGSA